MKKLCIPGDKKKVWATFWGDFSQTHLVTLPGCDISNPIHQMYVHGYLKVVLVPASNFSGMDVREEPATFI
jgi:hypothetical protein